MESLTGTSPELAEGYVAIGQIAAPWGIRGQVKVILHTDFPERFETMEVAYLGPDAHPVRVVASRPYKGHWLVAFEGYDDRTSAEALRGLWVQIRRKEVMPLEEGERYVFQLVGLRVRTTDGRDLGDIGEVLFTGANEVFVVRGDLGEVLIPYIADVVVAEDMEAGEILVEPIPGLLE